MWRAPSAQPNMRSSYTPSYGTYNYGDPPQGPYQPGNSRAVTPLPPPLAAPQSPYLPSRNGYGARPPIAPYAPQIGPYAPSMAPLPTSPLGKLGQDETDFIMVNRETLEDFECQLMAERARAKYLEEMLAIRQLACERNRWREEVEYTEYSPPHSPVSHHLPPPDPFEDSYHLPSPVAPQLTQLYAQIQTPHGPQFVPVTLGLGEMGFPAQPPMVLCPPPRSSPTPPSPYAIPLYHDLPPRQSTISMAVSPKSPPQPSDGVRILFEALTNSSGNVKSDALLSLLKRQNASVLPNIEGDIDFTKFDNLFRNAVKQDADADKVKALLHGLWKELDKDNSGFLDSQERMQLMQRFGIRTIVWRDTDADNKMDFEEFWGMIQNLPREELDKVYSAASVLSSQSWFATR